MTRIIGLALVASLALVSSLATAAERTVDLQLENFDCASCAFIVKRTISDIPGVATCDVSYRDKLARVTFDDAKTNIAALTAATAELGFPSRPVQ